MIGFLRGTILSVTTRGIILDVAGVGYRVDLTSHDLSRAQRGSAAELHCYTHVREDVLQLFGFFDEQARDFFEVLIGVSGVGPKTALQILSVGSPAQVRAAIEQADIDVLTSVSGIGKKLAQRIVLELRGKISDVLETVGDAPHTQAVEALVSLGFKKDDAARALRDTHGTTEELVRFGLKKLHGS